MIAFTFNDDVIRRIWGEYTEMPGLRVTPQQAQRLWGLDAQTCLTALEFLVETGFLCKLPGSQYARLTDGPAVRSALHMAKADVRRKVIPRAAVQTPNL
jgi:hypothetical protein